MRYIIAFTIGCVGILSIIKYDARNDFHRNYFGDNEPYDEIGHDPGMWPDRPNNRPDYPNHPDNPYNNDGPNKPSSDDRPGVSGYLDDKPSSQPGCSAG